MPVGLRATLYVVVGLGAACGLVPSLLADLVPGPLFLPGVLVGGLGLVVYAWTVWIFARFGRGTPVPIDPPRVMVVRGPYRWVRNPMALGFTLILVGESIAFQSWPIFVYAALWFAAIHLFVVFVEEPGLRRRFGAPYETYVRSVPRWVPRLSAPRGRVDAGNTAG